MKIGKTEMSKNILKRLKDKVALTMIELMIAIALMSVGVLALVSTMAYLAKLVQSSKNQSIATNLAQEKMEQLKSINYAQLVVSINTESNTCFPSLKYDPDYFPPEDILAGRTYFKRSVLIEKVREDASGQIVALSPNQPDTGLKRILVFVTWKEGQKCRKTILYNLRNDPSRIAADSTFYGTVAADVIGGIPIENARVEIIQNPSWYDDTDISGEYSFNLAEGTYTIKASSRGFTSSTLTNMYIGEGNFEYNFALATIPTGTVVGSAYLTDHLVISQVVPGAISPITGLEEEIVELYNPTTYYWQIAINSNTPAVDLKYQLRTDGSPQSLSATYNTLTIAPKGYYLFSNSATVTIDGVSRSADAVYIGNVLKTTSDPGYDAQSIAIDNVSTSERIDSIGWIASSQVPPFFETTPLNPNGGAGIAQNNQIIRKSSFSGFNLGNGRSYDNNTNSSDFIIQSSVLATSVRNSSSATESAFSGTPATGAIISIEDGLSSPINVPANINGSFTVYNVAEGTWTVYLSSGSNFKEIATKEVIGGAYSDLDNQILDTDAIFGYISGTVKDSADNPLSNITVSVPGALPVVTNSNGYYTLAIATGSYTAIANPSNLNPTYTQENINDVVVGLGELTSNVDFTLNTGGTMQGFATINGVDPFPGLAVDAQLSGISQKSVVTNSSGIFFLGNMPTGSYTIYPHGPNEEPISPGYIETTLNAGSTVFVGTFTVSGVYGGVEGHAYDSSTPIDTGVLVIATPETITTSNPPALNHTVRISPEKYYASVTADDGSYSIDLPAGTYNVYAWYTTINNSVPSVSKRSSTGVSVSELTKTTVDFNW
jgi:type II secretory pathway pseudopilin PulG